MKKILIILIASLLSCLYANAQTVSFTFDELVDVTEARFLGNNRYLWVAENNSLYKTSTVAENAVDTIGTIPITGTSLYANVVQFTNSGNTLFVYPNGNNDSAKKGDIKNAWSDPFNAINDADPGDHIYVFKGNYLQANTDRSFQTVITTDSLDINIEAGSLISTNGIWIVNGRGIKTLNWYGENTKTYIGRNAASGYGGACFQIYDQPESKFYFNLGEVTVRSNLDIWDIRNVKSLVVEFDRWSHVRGATFMLNLGDGTVNTGPEKDGVVFRGKKLEYNPDKITGDSINILYYGGAQNIANRNVLFEIDSMFLYPSGGGGNERSMALWLNHSAHNYTNVNVNFVSDYIEFEDPGTASPDTHAFIGTTANSWTNTGTSSFNFDVKELVLNNGKFIDYDENNLELNFKGNITGTESVFFFDAGSSNKLIFIGNGKTTGNQGFIDIDTALDSIFVSGIIGNDGTTPPIQSDVAQTVQFRSLNDFNTILKDADVTFEELPDYGAGFQINAANAQDGYFPTWNDATQQFDYTQVVFTVNDSIAFNADFIGDGTVGSPKGLAESTGGIFGTVEGGNGNGTIGSGFTSVDFPNNAVINFRDEDDANEHIRIRANANGSYSTGNEQFTSFIEFADTGGERFSLGIIDDGDFGLVGNSLVRDFKFETFGDVIFKDENTDRFLEITNDVRGAVYGGFSDDWTGLVDSSLVTKGYVDDVVSVGGDGNGIFSGSGATPNSLVEITNTAGLRFQSSSDSHITIWNDSNDPLVNPYILNDSLVLGISFFDDEFSGNGFLLGIPYNDASPSIYASGFNFNSFDVSFVDPNYSNQRVTTVTNLDAPVPVNGRNLVLGYVFENADEGAYNSIGYYDNVAFGTSSNFMVRGRFEAFNSEADSVRLSVSPDVDGYFTDNRNEKIGFEYRGFGENGDGNGGDYIDLQNNSLAPVGLIKDIVSDSIAANVQSPTWLATELPQNDVRIYNANTLELQQDTNTDTLLVMNCETCNDTKINQYLRIDSGDDIYGIQSFDGNISLSSTTTGWRYAADYFDSAPFINGRSIPDIDHVQRMIDDGVTWLKPELENGAVVIGANSNPFIINFMSTLQLSAGPNLEGGIAASAANTQLYGQDIIIRDTFIDNAPSGNTYVPVMTGGTGRIESWADASNVGRQWVETSATIPIIGTYVVTFPVNIPQDETELFVTYHDSDVFGAYTIPPNRYTITGANQITINNCCGFISQSLDRVYVKWLE
jgi:hypothetical protein